MQTLGLAHRVVHAKLGVVTAHVNEGHAGLWSEHTQSSDCQLFDQSCGDVLQSSHGLCTVEAWWPVWHATPGWGRHSAYERFHAARGPPVELT